MTDRLELELREHFSDLEADREPITLEEIRRSPTPRRLPWGGIAAATAAAAVIAAFAWLFVPESSAPVGRSTIVTTTVTTIPDEGVGVEATEWSDLGVVETPIGTISWTSWDTSAISGIESALPLQTRLLGEAGGRLYLVFQTVDWSSPAQVVSTDTGRSWRMETTLPAIDQWSFVDLDGDAALAWIDHDQIGPRLMMSRSSTGWIPEEIAQVPYREVEPRSDLARSDRISVYSTPNGTWLVSQHASWGTLGLDFEDLDVGLTARWSQDPSTLVVEVASAPEGSGFRAGDEAARVTWVDPVDDETLAALAAAWEGYTYTWPPPPAPLLDAFSLVWATDGSGGLGTPSIDDAPVPDGDPREPWPWYDVYVFADTDGLVRATGSEFERWDGERWVGWGDPSAPFAADEWPQQAGRGWVAGRDSQQFWVSADGASWVETALPQGLDVIWGWDTVALGESGWVAFAQDPTPDRAVVSMFASVDGSQWTPITLPDGVRPAELSDAKTTGDFVLVLAGDGSPNALGLYSRVYIGTIEGG